MKFGIGQPMRRDEDLPLVTGQGRYTDDIVVPRMAHAFVLRSPIAHARIKRLNAATARRMPGVLECGEPLVGQTYPPSIALYSNPPPLSTLAPSGSVSRHSG
jgi:CO/xanthine dehydrogenase Mo-binding subunit